MKMNKVDTAKIKADAQAIVDKIQLPRIPEREFRVDCQPFGDIRSAVNAAIRECSASGGGRVIIPAGRYRSEGPIHMASCVELHFEDGAFIKFSRKPEDYLPVVPSRWEGMTAQCDPCPPESWPCSIQGSTWRCVQGPGHLDACEEMILTLKN